jgi:multidrug efflux system membrane fusion protein
MVEPPFLCPSSETNMNRKQIIRIDAMVFGFLVFWLGAGCQPAKTPPAAPPPPAVTVARPGSALVQNYNEYNGYLDAVEMVEIRARVKGYLDEVLFKEGDEIKAGDKLYIIDPREYASAVARSKSDIARAEADMANARAQIKLAKSEFDRLRKLAESGTISTNEIERAEATLAANNAQLDVAVANKGSAEAALRSSELQLSYTDIRAPISGQISRTLVTRGNLVGQTDSTLLTTIVSIEPLFVYFDVPERDLIEYQRTLKSMTPAAKAAASARVEVGVATEAGYPHVGEIDFQENRVNTGTGTVRIRGRIPNPLDPATKIRLLYPGLFSRVRVPAGSPQTRFVLPEDALMTGQEGRFVYVVGPDNVVAKRTVTVGPVVWRANLSSADVSLGWNLAPFKPGPDGKTPLPYSARSIVSIESGLKEQDLVIVNGLQRSRPGAPVTPDEWQLRPPVTGTPSKQ